jgi:hypothetical protein
VQVESATDDSNARGRRLRYIIQFALDLMRASERYLLAIICTGAGAGCERGEK